MGFDDNILIGKTKEESLELIVAAGLKARVVMVDGKSCIGTCDYRLDRINLSIVDNKVVKVLRG